MSNQSNRLRQLHPLITFRHDGSGTTCSCELRRSKLLATPTLSRKQPSASPSKELEVTDPRQHRSGTSALHARPRGNEQLPLELLSEIFSLHAQWLWCNGPMRPGIVSLMKVCRLWRMAVLRTPVVWTFVDLSDRKAGPSLGGKAMAESSLFPPSGPHSIMLRCSLRHFYHASPTLSRGRPRLHSWLSNVFDNLFELDVIVDDIESWEKALPPAASIQAPRLKFATIAVLNVFHNETIKCGHFVAPELSSLTLGSPTLLDIVIHPDNMEELIVIRIPKFPVGLSSHSPRTLKISLISDGRRWPHISPPNQCLATKRLVIHQAHDPRVARDNIHIFLRNMLFPELEVLAITRAADDGIWNYPSLDRILHFSQLHNLRILRVQGCRTEGRLVDGFRSLINLECLDLEIRKNNGSTRFLEPLFQRMTSEISSTDPTHKEDHVLCPALRHILLKVQSLQNEEWVPLEEFLYSRSPERSSDVSLRYISLWLPEKRFNMTRLASVYRSHKDPSKSYPPTWEAYREVEFFAAPEGDIDIDFQVGSTS